jgi:DNA-binding NarL/FixJ family response regulator
MKAGRSVRAFTGISGEAGGLRVMLTVGDDLFRLGLTRLLADEGIEVVGADPVDALLLDLSSADAPPVTGARVVVLCGAEEEEMVAALAAGASAVVWRGSDAAVIAAALRASVAGAVVLPAGIAERTLGTYREEPAAAGGGAVETLSPRERDVLALLASGLTNEEIADELVVTASTVKNHMARIMAKLGARNRTHAAVMATRLAA